MITHPLGSLASTEKFAPTSYTLTPSSIQRSLNYNSPKIILWDTSLPSFQSAGFPSKVLVLAPVTHLSVFWPIMWLAVQIQTQYQLC